MAGDLVDPFVDDSELALPVPRIGGPVVERPPAGAVRRVGLTDLQAVAEPRHLGLVAWFDGWEQAQGRPGATFPRELVEDELSAWRQGWRAGKREQAMR